VKQYFAAGAQVVWLVYPETHEVEIWEAAAGPRAVLGENDALEAPGLLPGFSVRVGDFF
jgi:Uma2 family endonuclease